MRISRSLPFIILILVVQYIFLLFIPYILFRLYNSIVFLPGSILLDQLIKAFISFATVIIWIYQWMWVTNKSYRLLRR